MLLRSLLPLLPRRGFRRLSSAAPADGLTLWLGSAAAADADMAATAAAAAASLFACTRICCCIGDAVIVCELVEYGTETYWFTESVGFRIKRLLRIVLDYLQAAIECSVSNV